MHRCVPLHIRVTQSDVTIPVVFHRLVLTEDRSFDLHVQGLFLVPFVS